MCSVLNSERVGKHGLISRNLEPANGTILGPIVAVFAGTECWAVPSVSPEVLASLPIHPLATFVSVSWLLRSRDYNCSSGFLQLYCDVKSRSPMLPLPLHTCFRSLDAYFSHLAGFCFLNTLSVSITHSPQCWLSSITSGSLGDKL